MNVGELRRALEGVSDTREVVVSDGEHRTRPYRLAQTVETRRLMPLGDGYYHKLDNIDAPSMENLVFVIE